MFRSLLQNVSLVRLLLFTHISSVTAQLTCYDPDGSENTDDTPCNPDADVTHCCGSNSLCLKNSLCWQQDYASLNQGSCTDSSWSSPECFTNAQGNGAMCEDREFSHLLSTPHEYPHLLFSHICLRTNLPPADAYIFVCQQTGGQEFYCDTDDSIQCTNETSTPSFSIGPAYLANYESSTASYSTYTETATACATGDLVTTSTPESRPGDTNAATVTFTQTVTLPLPRVTGAAGAASSFIPIAQCPTHAGAKAGIGAGVGVPLAAALAGALCFGFWERRKRKRVEDDLRGGEKDEGRGIAGGIGGQGENGIVGRGG